MVPIRGTHVRIALIALTLALAAATVGAGQAAAHNPACIQTGHADGPHYEKNTSADTAFVHNPTLRSPDRPDSLHPDDANSIHNREGSCSVGDAQPSFGE